MRVKIAEIKISKRVRQDLGDMESLKKSLRRHGLLQPILVTNKNQLVSGFRRLNAARDLGWDEIDAIVIEPKSELEQIEMEMEENLIRKEFTSEEMISGFKRKKKLTNPNIFRRIWNFIKRLFGRG